ncbi:hypothetical protein FRB99_008625 [Tulasnella sp. 403]|nr:hypothetical protein FRB99_008625 [Tulasnella sp. 403]
MKSLRLFGRKALVAILALASFCNAYDMTISETDEQACTGVYAGHNSYINVTFDAESQGQVALVIYEWADSDYLGVDPSDPTLPRTYVCTTDAVRASLCQAANLGQFILSLPPNKTISQTSIWTAGLNFPPPQPQPNYMTLRPSNGTQDTPETIPVPTTKRSAHEGGDVIPTTPMTDKPMEYTSPIHYHISRTGYYCVGAIPVTVLHQGETGDQNHTHASFSAVAHFENEFSGMLPATDYPKINFYLAMMLMYAGFAAVWGVLCMKHRYDLLPIQNYVSALFGLLVVEMLANWGTIAELAARKQKYKLNMFKKLYRILMLAVIILGIFFVVSSLSFTSRYDEDYAPRSWKSRWWLLDGWLVLLYMFVFVTIAFLWRPTGNNRRLAMSDELAQDEEDAEDYDLEAIQIRGEQAKREAMLGIDEMGRGVHNGPDEGRIALPRDNDDNVVFEIGDEGSDDDGDVPRRNGRSSGERKGLMGKDRTD